MNSTVQKKACAYCGQTGPMTAEHIWPKSIIKRTNYKLRYSAKAGKTFSGDPTIKDVCAACNNGPLGELDNYVCELYDKYFVCPPKSGTPIKFKYDFSRLTRWLLKISYNSARTTGMQSNLLAPYASTILSEFAISPIHVGFFVGLGKAAYRRDGSGQKVKIQPLGLRCGPAILGGLEYQSWCELRSVVINGFAFTIVLMKRPTVSPEESFPLFGSIYGVPLQPNGEIRIPSPKKTTLDIFDGIQYWPAPKGGRIS